MENKDIQAAALEITTVVGCPVLCNYCPQDKVISAYNKRIDHDFKVMTLKTFRQCINKVPRDVQITFSGMAEPWLNNECTEMILYAHARGFKINVYTTAVGMSLKDISLIETIPFNHFVVHLPDNHNMTKIPHDKSHIEKIDRLYTSKIKNIRFVVIGKIHPAIKKSIPACPISEWYFNDRATNLKKEKAIKSAGKAKFRHLSQRNGKLSCSRTLRDELNQNVLFPNGDVVLCCMDFGMRHVIGNLRTDSYFDLFRSSEYRKIKEGLNHSANIMCRVCTAAERDTFPHRFKSRIRRNISNPLKSNFSKIYNLLTGAIN